MSKYLDQILELLTDARPDYISGQTIAEQLNISRMTVKKAMDQLKAEGFSIDSIHNKGHQLKTLPPTWHNGILASIFKHQSLIEHFQTYPSVDSTQQVAKKAILNDDRTMLILSDEQTAGKGRFKRVWQSSKGKGLWMSLVLRPNIPFSMLTTFNLFMSLAISEAIQSLSTSKVEIKWPNDIYIDGQKVCGFLTEMVANADGIEAVICGIGINLNHDVEDFDDTLRQTATSVKLHYGQNVNRYDFLEHLMQCIDVRYQQFLTEPFTTIKDEYIQRSNIWNKPLRFTEGKQQFYGKVIEIDDQGFLLVVDGNGDFHRLMSADIDF
ncbi:biotin--[acetyl-CoA-carboxylase] ligase [Staphylococcus intermedius]|uniref:Bifunctional ligase/repressor BirA n=1 Tax=Staphylococcus intermedius NCTC 11048 TaxID=1141106 RepID=A0A380G911_STAIN|nr:biotin--[acetyl-CoA-carboxylase] ligase [Staphylococcus intermedius]PCF64897.1 bifunctional biotin--[acetyl-CoA-carboxylase] synthetase/biotin operon repressor [Staphylococcus intermedius]PCF80507.1 bifunctional biotin--[acetyl-CoA-carboxylase] synthetase/biotin operon repressor [Staphylococcus intermedius]PCF81857.1 bifunctional biotin--[acetyl-CoA-carboxylase] synthetase/biotin operon repressor [Staphylococcus intermedius]PCF88194.1 bifunctional biotin--[acetyl-CoA-carboxylase] synthetase/